MLYKYYEILNKKYW